MGAISEAINNNAINAGAVYVIRCVVTFLATPSLRPPSLPLKQQLQIDSILTLQCVSLE